MMLARFTIKCWSHLAHDSVQDDSGFEMSHRGNKALADIHIWAINNYPTVNVKKKTKAALFHHRNKQFQLSPYV